MRSFLRGLTVSIFLGAAAMSAVFAQDRSSTAASGGASSSCDMPPLPPGAPKPPKSRPPAASSAGTQVYVTCEAPAQVTPAALVLVQAASPAASSESTPGGSKPSGEASAHGPSHDPPEVATWVRNSVILLTCLAGLVSSIVGAMILWFLLDRRSGQEGPGDPSAAPAFRPASPFAFRRHWGSFGGESTGWNLSPRLVALLTGALLIVLGGWLLLRVLAAIQPPLPSVALAPALDAKPQAKPASVESK